MGGGKAGRVEGGDRAFVRPERPGVLLDGDQAGQAGGCGRRRMTRGGGSLAEAEGGVVDMGAKFRAGGGVADVKV